MTTFQYSFRANGVNIYQLEYCNIYIAPWLSPQDVNLCLSLIKYQAYCIYFEMGRDPSLQDLIHKDTSSGQQYFMIEAYSVKVYFEILGSICTFLDSVFY